MKMPRLISTALAAILVSLLTQVPLMGASTDLAPAKPQSLAGEWRFAMDRDDVGVAEKWYLKDLSDKIKLPGILQGQGYGDDISVDTPWVSSARLGPSWWLTQPDSVRAKYSQLGHVEVPFLSQPAKHYLGVAW
jgi:beta-galactosidase